MAWENWSLAICCFLLGFGTYRTVGVVLLSRSLAVVLARQLIEHTSLTLYFS